MIIALSDKEREKTGGREGNRTLGPRIANLKKHFAEALGLVLVSRLSLRIKRLEAL